MNDCPLARQLTAYHDGELSAENTREFQSHLSSCPQCSAELDRLRRLGTLLQSVPAPAISDVSLRRLHRSIDRLDSRRTLRMAEGIAAAAAIVLLACMLTISGQSEATAASSQIPLWETQALAGQAPGESNATEELLASWMAQDLAGDSHE